MKILMYLLCLTMSACDGSSDGNKSDVKSGSEPITGADKIPLHRNSVSAQPVAEYRERSDNRLNEWYFSVSIFETSKTFDYLLKLQYEEVVGEDTLRLPNFGTMPEPVIQKGPEQYSCIIGFKDNEGNFREFKKVFVQNGNLKVRALKHYSTSPVDNED